jgi:hypothetical protein
MADRSRSWDAAGIGSILQRCSRREAAIDIFQPFPLSPETNAGGTRCRSWATEKPGVSVQSAQAEVTLLAALDRQTHKDRNDFEPKVSALPEHVSGRLRPALLLLVSARRGGDADRVRESFELVAGAGHDSAERDCDSRGAGSGEGAIDGQMLTESVLLSITELWQGC